MPHVNIFVTVGHPKYADPIINNHCIAPRMGETYASIGKTERLRAVGIIKHGNRASKIKPAQLYWVVYNSSGQVLAKSVNTPNNMLKT